MIIGLINYLQQHNYHSDESISNKESLPPNAVAILVKSRHESKENGRKTQLDVSNGQRGLSPGLDQLLEEHAAEAGEERGRDDAAEADKVVVVHGGRGGFRLLGKWNLQKVLKHSRKVGPP